MNFDAVKDLFKPISSAELDRLVAARYGHGRECSVGLDDVGLENVARVAAKEVGRAARVQKSKPMKSIVQPTDARRSITNS